MSVAYTRRKSVVCCRFFPEHELGQAGRPAVLAASDPAATKRDAQSEFEHRHAGARSPYFVQSKDTADVNGTSSQAAPSEAWWRTRSNRYKTLIGPEMRTRTLARQRVEHRIGCEILNKMTALGMPDAYCAG